MCFRMSREAHLGACGGGLVVRCSSGACGSGACLGAEVLLVCAAIWASPYMLVPLCASFFEGALTELRLASSLGSHGLQLGRVASWLSGWGLRFPFRVHM